MNEPGLGQGGGKGAAGSPPAPPGEQQRASAWDWLAPAASLISGNNIFWRCVGRQEEEGNGEAELCLGNREEEGEGPKRTDYVWAAERTDFQTNYGFPYPSLSRKSTRSTDSVARMFQGSAALGLESS